MPLAPAGTPFQRAVWQAIATVPYGATIAYRELARARGRPGSVRAAGAATGRNPLSIVIPCHRIVGADGALTGYAGGLERKRALLALEQRARARRCLPRLTSRGSRTRPDDGCACASPTSRGSSRWRDLGRVVHLHPRAGAGAGAGADGGVARADRRRGARRVLPGHRASTPSVARHWRQYLVIGIVNSALPFMLFAFAALYLPASYSVILNADDAALHRAAGGAVARRAADRDEDRGARRRRGRRRAGEPGRARSLPDCGSRSRSPRASPRRSAMRCRAST